MLYNLLHLALYVKQKHLGSDSAQQLSQFVTAIETALHMPRFAAKHQLWRTSFGSDLDRGEPSEPRALNQTFEKLQRLVES